MTRQLISNMVVDRLYTDPTDIVVNHCAQYYARIMCPA